MSRWEKRDRFVVRDPKQPLRKALQFLKPAQALIGFEESLLGQVQGVLAAFELPQQVVVDALFPTRDQHIEGLDVAAPAAQDQVPVFDLAEDQIHAPSNYEDAQRGEKVWR